ncbi:leucine--tRNA ligase [Marivirga tractuosa]|uniref:Leucine--tRNA ligase n=1 Tax=Marivirga tractuosa (strain ATCC 23168 / DSM 4126 / NBRC 15989 / NCIMB 1408 / VKM B-1430 / H-43) TaxID=643867 RepID=E4TKM3_MARTH|nr:leucine--tRNA ligase [Marivirga tractuosa]ADR21189.1 leucyl-tRNA synthetase [Marivirga tractuosa DSM 4126]BDD14358.1 leucine--tRNA ligase [Marivirga tractuosa]
MSEYQFRETEKKWQAYWEKNQIFKAEDDFTKPKYYTLDMFPYPSGAGLHVGHPLGYIASDIVARYKKQQGFNVLHPMGFDSFGLPAEQYAIQTGQHPAITTEENINRYIEQLKNIGFAYDWEREVRTSDPSFYKWTQWIFSLLFNSWYDQVDNRARHILVLEEHFEKTGNQLVKAACDEDIEPFTAEDWFNYSEEEKQKILLKYRIAYLSEAVVNWCPALGTVLSNDEVKDGYSERGGHPVERKKMMQWSMRISAFADRLLRGLEDLDWPEPVKEMQRNWIGKSVGAQLAFQLAENEEKIEVFTTRIDTIYGVTFMVLAPEHELVEKITTDAQRQAVEEYVNVAKNRSERERMTEVKRVSGVFTGAYAVHPFTEEKIPVWIGDYVLAGYGTGAVMAVPSDDDRDKAFAEHFELPIVEVVDEHEKIINSDFLTGLSIKDAQMKAIDFMKDKGIGYAKINYRMRDAIFSRQRYWGEPVPVYFKNEIPYLLEEEQLPLELPEVDKYLPTEDGEPPLARAKNWKTEDGYELEKSTMPGWAGSSWYMFRYMDAQNKDVFVDEEKQQYWQNVDLYIGGSEHATGHLLYSRFWTKFLYDLGYISVDEPFQKMINQGMIQGRSNFVYRIEGENKFVSHGLKDQYKTQSLHVDVNIVHNDVLDLEVFKKWRPEHADAEFILEDGKYICGAEVEKMSKSKYNVVNPDDVIEKYGADTLRLYEMFLGPLEQFKPWNTNGIDGTAKFLKKLWRLFHDTNGNFKVEEGEADKKALKALHQAIQKAEYDIENFSFNTSVSTFMICVNTLTELKCNNKAVLSDLVRIIAPYAPHICEELWSLLGNEGSISEAGWPTFNPDFVKEDEHTYPVSVNGKHRDNMTFALDAPKEEIEKAVLENPKVQKWIEDKPIKKMIIVPKKIVNIVV